MTKKGPLGTAEMFYVEGKYKDNDVKEIAKVLDRAVVTIQKYVNKCVEKEPATAPPRTGNLMARREGVVLMTESASSMSDEAKTKKGSRSRKSCVTRIKDD